MGRTFHAHNQHVFRHPAFIARDVGSDTQREALLSEQRIAAISRAIAPDLSRLGEVDDVLLLVAGPGNVSLSRLQRSAHRMQAGNDSLFLFVDLSEHGGPNPRHDAHVHYSVG